MDIIGLLKAVFRALEEFLKLKNRSFYYDIVTKSKNYQKELIDEIEKLRNTGTNSSNDRADLLRAQLLQERKTLEHLSAVYTLSGER